ncbi:MAG: DNA-3-methyladenine glycosylase II [Porticoccus sp.]
MCLTEHHLSLFKNHPYKEEIFFLSKKDVDLKSLFLRHSGFRPFKRKEGFEGLVQLITEQQLSVASAKAIFNRLKKTVPIFKPKEFLQKNDLQLQSTGLSRPKIGYCRILAERIISKDLSFRVAHQMNNEELKKELCKIKGIGTWTAECYMLASLQRRDIWPAKDVGLQVAIQRIKNLKSRPTEKEMVVLAAEWQPYRSIVANVLWASYD